MIISTIIQRPHSSPNHTLIIFLRKHQEFPDLHFRPAVPYQSLVAIDQAPRGATLTTSPRSIRVKEWLHCNSHLATMLNILIILKICQMACQGSPTMAPRIHLQINTPRRITTPRMVVIINRLIGLRTCRIPSNLDITHLRLLRTPLSRSYSNTLQWHPSTFHHHHLANPQSQFMRSSRPQVVGRSHQSRQVDILHLQRGFQLNNLKWLRWYFPLRVQTQMEEKVYTRIHRCIIRISNTSRIRWRTTHL